MSDEQDGPERIDVQLPQMGVVPAVGVEIDSVHQERVPSGLVAAPGEAGVKTEWDAASLDNAIRWLEAHADYLHRLSYDMTDLQDLMGGPAGGKSPLGTFDWAVRLSQKHAGLYTATESAVKSLSESLYDAAKALRRVKENYENAEGVNAMSAADMQKVFADVARGPQA